MKQISLFILLFGLAISPVLAQNNSCNLQLNVYKYPLNPATALESIKDVVPSLKSTQSQTIIKSGLQNDVPYFANVPKGTYQITISLKGYKTTIKEIDLTCEISNEQNIMSEIVFLWEGSSKDTMKMFGEVFVAKGKDEIIPNSSIGNILKVEKTELTGGKALILPQPFYPPAAKVIRAVGAVKVQIINDELGRVISAKAMNGHPLLRTAAEKAALGATFELSLYKEMPVKIAGEVTYNFVP